MISTQITVGFHFAGPEISGLKVLKLPKVSGPGNCHCLSRFFGIRFIGGVSYPVVAF